MINYDKLRSTAQKGDKTIFKTLGYTIEEVKDLPIKYLRISPELKDLLSSKGSYFQSFNAKAFKTMGALVDAGYLEVAKYLANALGTDKGLDALQEVQEALAEFALKLMYTDFTVFDIRTSFLMVSDITQEWMQKNHFETIGDLYIYGTSGFVRTATNEKRGTRIVSEIKEAMKAFGTKPEKVKIHDIPPKKNIDKKEEGKPEEILAKKRQEYFPRISLCIETERELKQRELEEAISKEKQKETDKFLESSTKPEQKPQPVSNGMANGLMAAPKVQQTQIVTYRVVPKAPAEPTQRTTQKLNIQSTAQLPLHMLGLRVDSIRRIIEKLDVKTIGDLTKYSFSQLLKKGFTYDMVSRILKTLSFYGLTLKEDGIKIEASCKCRNPQQAKRNAELKKEAEELGIETEGKNARQISQQLRILKHDMEKAKELGISVEEYKKTKTTAVIEQRRKANEEEAKAKGITLSELRSERLSESWRKRKESGASYVNPNAGAGVARVQPVHFQKLMDEHQTGLDGQTPPSLPETQSPKSGARKGKRNSRKFYHNEFGYARTDGRVKLYHSTQIQNSETVGVDFDDGWQL